jgi:hypothetical protein
MPEISEQELAALRASHDQLQDLTAAGPAPVPYAGPAGAGQLAAPLQPAPPPAPPREPDVPHPGVRLRPGELARYTYHDHRDPEGVNRDQLVMVSHTDDDHVHGFVVGNLQEVASFLHGQLARHGDEPGTAAG